MKYITMFLLFLVIGITVNAQVLGDFRSRQTGNWNTNKTRSRYDGAAWQNAGAGEIPTIAAADTEIQTGHTVTIINNTDHCNNILVNGTLTYRDAGLTFTVNGNMQINAGGVFEVCQAVTQNRNQTFYLYGNLVVDGTLDGYLLSGGSEARMFVHFVGTNDATLTGTGAICEFYSIRMNKGADMTAIFDIQRTIVIDQADANNQNRLYAENGTLKFSASTAPNTLVPYINDRQVCTSTAKFWYADPNITITSANAGNMDFRGDLQIDNGTINCNARARVYGNFISNNGTFTIVEDLEFINTGTATINGGAITCDDDIRIYCPFSISGGTLTATGPMQTENYIRFYGDGANLATLTATGGTITAEDYLRFDGAAGTSDNTTYNIGELLYLTTSANIQFNSGAITVGSSLTYTGSSISLNNTSVFTVTGGVITSGDGNNRFYLNNTATLDISGGTILHNGYFECTNTANTFTMTGGNLNIDPNDVNMIPANRDVVRFRENTIVNFTGGTLMIIDPHPQKDGIFRDAIEVRGQAGNKDFVGSTIQFGDGVSVSNGTPAFPGYGIYIGGADLQLGNIILNNPAGTNREFICRNNTNILCNNLTITTPNDKYVLTGRNLEIDGNAINNGEIDGTTDTYADNHISFTGTAAQSYSGTGSLTSNMAELTFLNTSATGVSLSADIGAEIVNLTDGHVYTNASGSGLLTVFGTDVTDLVGGTAANYVQGPLRRAIPSGAAAAQYDFPVGKTDYRKWETLGLSTGGSGSGFITLNYFDAVVMSGKTAGNGLANPTVAEPVYWQMTTDLSAVTLSAIAAIQVTHPDPAASPPKVLGQSNNNINGSYSGIGATAAAGTILSDNFDITGLTATGDAFVIISEVEPLTGTYTVGATGDYLNLTTIAAELRVKYVDDNVIFEMLADYDDNTETIPVNFDVVNLTLPTWSVTIRPQLGVAGTQTIRAGTSGAMIIFDNIGKLTFDGRPGGVGTSDWEFSNIDATPGPVFGYQNDANNTDLTYLTIKSDVQSTTSGVITFGTSTEANGNDDNEISNCSISGKAATPTNIIYSDGTASAENGGNYIFNNDIFDFFNADENTVGILIDGNNEGWSIQENRFFQTSARVFTTGKTYKAIEIQDGNGHFIFNNTIGYADNAQTGFTDISGSTGKFKAIHFKGSNGTNSTINKNTISGIKFATGSAATEEGIFCGVHIDSGDAIVGTGGNGNIIGSILPFASYPIQITATGNGAYITPIHTDANRPTSIRSNAIGGIEISDNERHYFTGIRVNNTSGDYTLSNNTIGSNSQAESIKVGSPGDGNWHGVYGIYVRRSGDITISGNTIANIINYSESSNQNNRTRGIYSQDGVNTISGNRIYKLTTYSEREGGTTSASIAGIIKTSTDAGQSITNNEIYELKSLTTFAEGRDVVVEGIVCQASSSTKDDISGNFVHNLSALSEDATLHGIRIYGGTMDLTNNMVQLGIDETGADITTSITIFGISHEATEPCDFYHNSVYIGGSGVNTASADTSYCFYKEGIKASNIQNNIFYNARSSSGASSNAHYAIMLPQEETVNQDYNIYYAPGNDGLLARFEGVDLSTIYGVKSYPTNGNDLHSGMGDPIFINPTGSSTTADLHVSGTTPAEGMGILIASVVTDIDNETRSALSPVDIGADAGNFSFDATVDIFSPNFDYTLIDAQACGITSTTIDVTITDQGTGVPLAGGNVPRIYYRDQATQAWLAPASTAQGVLQSGDGNSSVWRFTLTGLANTKYYEYYFAAQDQASAPLTPNIGFSKFDDNSPIHTNVNTMTTGPDSDVDIDVFSVCLFPKAVYHVGNDAGCIAKKGSVCDFETLTAAIDLFYNLNSVTIDKNVQVLIVADTQEPAIYGLHNLTEDGSGPYTISIDPYDASAISLLSDNTVNNKEIRFEGADRITINGEFAGDGQKWLTFEHEKEEQQVFYFVDDSQNDVIKNINIKGSSNLNPQGLIYLAGTTVAAATGNNNIIFDNNKISKSTGNPLNIVYSEGTVGAENSGIQFTNNEILDFQNHGIWATATANNGWTISDNTLYTGVVSDTLEAVILIESGEGYTVSGNFMGGSDVNLGGAAMENNGSPAFTAISLNVGTGVASNITNNTIKNIACTDNGWSGAMTAIYAEGLINITGNTVENFTNTKNSALYGIDYEDGPGGVNISDNTFKTLVSSRRGSFYGIRYQPTDAVASTIQNNSVTGVTFNSVDKWTYFYGLLIQGNALVNNNQVGGHTVAEKITLAGDGHGYGISINSNDFDSDYTNNKVYNVEFGGNARFGAHYFYNTDDPVTVSLQGNEADNITLTNTGSDARVYGFFLDDAICNFGTITPNLVGSATYGISNAGTGVTTAIYVGTNETGSQIHNNVVTNINGAGLVTGIDFSTSNTPATALNNTIKGCNVTYSTNFTGIKIRSSNKVLDGNIINDIAMTNAGASSFNGISVEAGTGNTVGTNSANLVGAITKEITNAGTGETNGISISGGSGAVVQNNAVSYLTAGKGDINGILNSTSSVSLLDNTIDNCNITDLTDFSGVKSNSGSLVSIQNNTIQNITLPIGAGGHLKGISITGGSALVGTVTGNKIGTAGNPIRNNGSGSLHGINITSNTAGNIVSQNIFTEITGAGGVACINSTCTNDIQITNHDISGWAVADAQEFIGISATGENSSANISNNIIHDFSLSSVNTSAYFIGILLMSGNADVHSNTIHTVSCASTQTATSGIVALQGINAFLMSANDIYQNSIYGLTSIGTAATSAIGISESSAGVTIRKNNIKNIRNTSTDASAKVSGIILTLLDAGYVSNNMISLGTDAENPTYAGIRIDGNNANTKNVYFNSIYMGGNSTGTNNSYAFLRTGTANLNLRNNIFSNFRTGTGKHYAIANVDGGNWTSNSHSKANGYYSSTASTVGLWGAADVTFNTWMTNSGELTDYLSTDAQPFFIDAPNGDLHLTNLSDMCGFNSVGEPFGSITDDFDGDARATNPDIGADEFTPTGRAGKYIWRGWNSSNWDTGTNWQCEISPVNNPVELIIVPKVATNPVIQRTLPAATVLVDPMEIHNGASLTINPGNSLTLNGDLNLAGSVIIETPLNPSDASGSFIDNGTITGSGTMTAKRFLNAGQYHEVSSAVENVNSDIFTETNPSGNYNINLYWYDETLDLDGNSGTAPAGAFDNNNLVPGWQFVQASSGAGVNLEENLGYMFYTDMNQVITMTGTPSTGNYDVTGLTHTANDVNGGDFVTADLYDGWELLGNPYPSSLDWDAMKATRTNIDDAIYVWDDTGYSGYINGTSVMRGNLTNEIAPMQGFMVHTNANGAGVQINNSHRTHNAPQYLRNIPQKQNFLRLKTSANGHEDFIVVHYLPEATREFDGNLDLLRMFVNPDYGDATLPQLYSITENGNPLAYNTLPLVEMESKVVPLGFRIGNSGNYTISAVELNDFEGLNIYLHDTQENRIVNLRTNPSYNFDYAGGKNETRFYLNFVGNHAPVAENQIDAQETLEDEIFTFAFAEDVFTDVDFGDALRYETINLPSWLSFHSLSRSFNGIPENENVGLTEFEIIAFDNFNASDTTTLSINVINTNDAPIVEAEIPDTETTTDEMFVYNIAPTAFADIDLGDNLTLSAQLPGGYMLPDWLLFDDEANSFSGLPAFAQVIDIEVTATDNWGATVSDVFQLTVTGAVKVPSIENVSIDIYPNPVTDYLTIALDDYEDQENISVSITDIAGKVVYERDLVSKKTEINLTQLSAGAYFLEVHNNLDVLRMKFVKN